MMINQGDKFIIKGAARKFNCDRKIIRYWLKKLNIKRYMKKNHQNIMKIKK